MHREKGIALFVILVTLLIAILFANIILSLALSQYRLTHHQTSRIRAYYAAKAGMNLAFENIRTGTWAPSPSQPYEYDLNDTDIPYPVHIKINPVSNNPSDPFNGCRKVEITTTYTYTLP